MADNPFSKYSPSDSEGAAPNAFAAFAPPSSGSGSNPFSQFAPTSSSSPVNGQPPAAVQHLYQDPNQPWYKRAWDWGNTPITESLFGMPEERQDAGGFERAVEHIASGLTSPLSLALTAATFGTGGAVESVGASALREAGLGADEIANAVKGAEVASTAAKSLPSVEPVIQKALEEGGHDLGLLRRAKEATGPLDMSEKFGSDMFQKSVTSAEGETQPGLLEKAGFNPEERDALGKASETINQAKAGFTPVDDALKEAGVDVDKWKQAQDTLYKHGLSEKDLLGGNMLERGAYKILRTVAPDISVAATARAAKTANTILNAGFTYQQLESAAAMSPRFLDALKEGDYDHAIEYGTEALVGGGLGIAGASHALSAWGDLTEPLFSTRLAPGDVALAVKRDMGEREALHDVANTQATELYKKTNSLLGHEPANPITGDKPEVQQQKALSNSSVFHQIVTGGDKEKAAAWYNALAEAVGKDDRISPTGEAISKAVKESPEFKNWFKGSQVADSSGNAKTVYHGSNRAGFEGFRKDVLNPDSLYGSGVYVTENPEIASDYAASNNVRGTYSHEDLKKYYTPGNIVKSYGGRDRVLEFRDNDPRSGGWMVKVQGVDKNGNPLPGLDGRERWHHTSPDVAEFNQHVQGGKAVYPLQASIKNPFDMDSTITRDQAQKIFGKYNKTGWIERSFGDKDSVPAEKLYRDAMYPMGHGDYTGNGSNGIEQEPKVPSNDANSAQDQINTILREAGYDGIKHTGGQVTGGKPHQVWIAFDPAQIRPKFDTFGVDPNRPVNGLPPDLDRLIESSNFKNAKPEYQNMVLDSLKRVAEGKLSDKELAAAKYVSDQQSRNFEIGANNGLLTHQIQDYMRRVYKDENPDGKVVLSHAKSGNFATRVSMARQRVYDSHLTALLKSPKEIDFNVADNIAQGRSELIKAAANKQFMDRLLSKGRRWSDGRPLAVLSGTGRVVSGPNGEDPMTFVSPDRVRKINISDDAVAGLEKSGDLQRFLDEGTIKDLTPYIHPDNIHAAIARLEDQGERKEAQYDEVGNNKLRTDIMYLKSMLTNNDFSGLKDFNAQMKKVYAFDPHDYVTIDNAAMRGWNFVTNDPGGHRILVNTDIKVHPEFVDYLKNRLGLEKSGVGQSPVGKTLLRTGTKLKGLLLNLSPFHMVQEGLRAVMLGMSPFHAIGPDVESGARVNPADPASPTKIFKGVQNGLTTGTDYKAMQQSMEGVASEGDLIRKIPGVGKVVANSMNFYHDFLFKKYIPALKARGYELLFDRYQEAHPDWSVDRVAKVAAEHANDTFGGINWKAMGRSAATQDWMRIFTLAPDWMEAEMRSGARLFNKEEGGVSRMQVARMTMGMWGVARVLNLLTTGNPQLQAPFGLATKNKEGKEVDFSMRTLPTDLLHAATDPVGFMAGRLSPTVRAGEEVLSGRDLYGRKMAPQDLFADVFRNMAPIPLQAVGQAVSGTGPEVGNAGQLWKGVGGMAMSYQTPAQKMAAELAASHSEDGPVDPSQMARHRAIINLTDKVRAGEIPWSDVVKLVFNTGQIKESEMKHMQNVLKSTQGMDSTMASLYARAARLPAQQYFDVLAQANPAEKAALVKLTQQVSRKYMNRAMKDMTPLERAQDPLLQKILNMRAQPQHQ